MESTGPSRALRRVIGSYSWAGVRRAPRIRPPSALVDGEMGIGTKLSSRTGLDMQQTGDLAITAKLTFTALVQSGPLQRAKWAFSVN
jgi:hypothetical protein